MCRSMIGREAGVPVLGVVENMSGMCCPHCGGDVEPFQTGGGEVAALSLGVPFLGRIPLDHRLLGRAEAGSTGTPDGDDSPGARAMAQLAERVAAVHV